MYSSLTKVIQTVASVQSPSCVILFSFYTIIFLQRSEISYPFSNSKGGRAPSCQVTNLCLSLPPSAAFSSGDFCKSQME